MKKLLSPEAFTKCVEEINRKHMAGEKLTLYELYIEACDNYNKMREHPNNLEDRNYFEGQKIAYENALKLMKEAKK
jgi:hypothetical protein